MVEELVAETFTGEHHCTLCSRERERERAISTRFVSPCALSDVNQVSSNTLRLVSSTFTVKLIVAERLVVEIRTGNVTVQRE